MMTDAVYQCTLCRKKRPGRFTRRKGAAGGGWSQGFDLPAWFCWSCLKPGEGRDESEETMPRKSAVVGVTSPATARTEALAKSAEVLKILPSFQTEVQELTVTDAESYAYADMLLGRIKDARSGWLKVWERIQERTIKPIRQGLEELYGLNREVDVPMEKLYELVRTKMQTYKTEEASRLLAAQQERDREAERLRQEADAKARAAQAAQTPQLRGRLEAARQRLAEQAEQVAVEEVPEPVEGQRSTTRTVTRWRIKDLSAFHRGIADGTLPAECALINMPVMNRHFKDDPEGMKVWPGVEVYDDVQIVGR